MQLQRTFVSSVFLAASADIGLTRTGSCAHRVLVLIFLSCFDKAMFQLLSAPQHAGPPQETSRTDQRAMNTLRLVLQHHRVPMDCPRWFMA
jgi:hypothetical protein